MSKTVFYYLKIDGKFVSLQDMDEVLCHLLGIEVSNEKYMVPEGNHVSWKDVLTDILLELPYSKCKDNKVSLNNIIEAICHFWTDYDIKDVNPYVRCYYIIKMLNGEILTHFANLSMFDDAGRDYYRHLYDNEAWMNKSDLFDYVHKTDASEKINNSIRSILRDIYYSQNTPTEKDNDVFINQVNNSVVYRNETGLYECDEQGMLMKYYPSIDNLLGESVVREHYTFGDEYYNPCVKRMVIPEGVKSLRDEFFRGGLVENELILPSTLTSIGSHHERCVLANTHLSKVVLPDSLEMIGVFAFDNSIIEELVYPQKLLDYPYLRQFNGSRIKHLFLPKELFCSVFGQKDKARKTLQAYDAAIDNIHYY